MPRSSRPRASGRPRPAGRRGDLQATSRSNQYGTRRPSRSRRRSSGGRPWWGRSGSSGAQARARRTTSSGGFIRGNDEVAYPNLMFTSCRLRSATTAPRRPPATATRRHRPMDTDARGRPAHLHRPARAPGDPFLPLDPHDRRSGSRRALATVVLNQPRSTRSTRAGSHRPSPRPTSNLDGWPDAETALHPSCTCRLGVDELSVLDPHRCACTGSTACASSTPRCSPT